MVERIAARIGRALEKRGLVERDYKTPDYRQKEQARRPAQSLDRNSLAVGPRAGQKPPPPKHVAMSWAKRVEQVFGVEIEGCAGCGDKLRIIASIEEPEVILAAKAGSHDGFPKNSCRDFLQPVVR